MHEENQSPYDRPTQNNNHKQNNNLIDSPLSFKIRQETNPCYYDSNFIISSDSTNQVLTIILQPHQQIWYNGQIIASNKPNTSQNSENFDFDRFLHLFNMKWNIPNKFKNAGPEIAYFCIRRKGGGGKILCLDQRVYLQRFIVDLSKILIINQDPLTIQPKTISNFPYLSKLIVKSNDQNRNYKLRLLLQSNNGNLIFQKSLGVGQKLFIGNSNVIAMSQSIEAKINESNHPYLVGPGFVFLQSPSVVYKKGMQMQGQPQINACVFLLIMITFSLIVLLGFLD